ncbi:TPR repeat containing protein [Myxococcus stipitatus DSM 14675]|uniref:TPR repeat containing protein n=1 Tax=Myxococcus stipitatus (strain DSM 14675 / JCM 12634 / Mx s8) TaxID=1278073 RepID=L7U4G5_MYXSD|nr:SH3 domain-containing protein [Myxococcus stipitatus]AGC43706.1 TPR repeat containing protein [Myxococcus stipitatus DSM 14675]
MAMQPRRLVDGTGRTVQLGQELRRGGEGIIFEVTGAPGCVAKVFLRTPSPEKTSKLLWMTSNRSGELERLAAWPVATLHEHRGGPPMGFIMPRIEGYKEIHNLYGLQSRRQHFPKADWAFLLTAAANCAVAFDAVHQLGHVVGDVNEGNLLVSPKDATVRLIDCDSFQVVAGHRVFLCDVATALFTPPELIGQNLKQVTRRATHDQFGLAVLIFHLLFLGRHPYSGRFLGMGEMSPERAISEHRFAFGRNAAALQMAAPPFVPALGFLPPSVGELFERAFDPHPERAGRPSAEEWTRHLLGLLKQLRTCPKDANHRYPNHQNSCPWCKLLADGGPAFFLGLNAVLHHTFNARAVDLDSLWAELSRIPALNLPAKPTASPARVAAPLPADATQTLGRIALVRSFCAMTGAIVTMGVWIGVTASPQMGLFLGIPAAVFVLISKVYWWWLRRSDVVDTILRERQATNTAAQTALMNARKEWEGLAPLIATTQNHRAQLETLRRDYIHLQPTFESENNQLIKSKEASQKRDFLRNVFIRNHSIRNIGDGRKAMLRSYHVETALDVLTHRILGVVPGFGPALTDALTDWARAVEAQFRFDARKGVSDQERNALVARFLQRQAQLKSRIEQTLEELRTQTRTISTQLSTVQERLTHCLTAVAQAHLDLASLAPGSASGTKVPFWGGRGYWTMLATLVALALFVAEGDAIYSALTAPIYVRPEGAVVAPDAPKPVAEVLPPPLPIPRDCVVRSTPAVSALRMGTVSANTPLIVTAKQDGWRKVLLPEGQEGWTGPRCWMRLASTGGACRGDEDCSSTQCSLPLEGQSMGQCL